MKSTSKLWMLIGGGSIIANIMQRKKYREKLEKDAELSSKIITYYFLINRWLKMNQKGESIVDYFIKKGFRSLAIYGYKELGERLYDELKGTDIEVKCIIDKDAASIMADIDVYTPDSVFLPKVDAIVVTSTYYYDEIEEELSDNKIVDCPIISLEEIIK